MEELLKGLGFTLGESKVYLALLELPESATGQIIKKAHVSRSKVYEMLDKLIEKGLVSFVIKKRTRYYSASNPDSLMPFIDSKKLELEQQTHVFKERIKELKDLFKMKSENQSTTFYEGIAGIKTLYNSILSEIKTGDEYYAISVEPEKFSDDFKLFIESYHKKRAEKGINVLLLTKNEMKKEVKEILGEQKLMQIKYTQLNIPNSILIFGNKVVNFVWGKNACAVIISSSIISSRYKSFFKEMWKIAKR